MTTERTIIAILVAFILGVLFTATPAGGSVLDPVRGVFQPSAPPAPAPRTLVTFQGALPAPSAGAARFGPKTSRRCCGRPHPPGRDQRHVHRLGDRARDLDGVPVLGPVRIHTRQNNPPGTQPDDVPGVRQRIPTRGRAAAVGVDLEDHGGWGMGDCGWIRQGVRR